MSCRVGDLSLSVTWPVSESFFLSVSKTSDDENLCHKNHYCFHKNAALENRQIFDFCGPILSRFVSLYNSSKR